MPNTLNDLIEAINTVQVVPSVHSLNEAAADNILLDEIYSSVNNNGEIIEDYPDAYPLPACLVISWNQEGEPIHSVWGYNRITRSARLITVYRPDPNRWIDWRIRR